MLIGAKTVKVTDPRDEAELEVTYWVASAPEADSIAIEHLDGGDHLSIGAAGRVVRAIEKIRLWARSAAGKKEIRRTRESVHRKEEAITCAVFHDDREVDT